MLKAIDVNKIDPFPFQIRQNLPKSFEWQSFYVNDLPLVIDYCKDVQEASMQNGLIRSQTMVLETLKEASS